MIVSVLLFRNYACKNSNLFSELCRNIMRRPNLFIQALVHDVYTQVNDNDEISYTVKYV